MEREDGHLSRFETHVFDEPDDRTLYHVERLVKFLVWAWGGWKIHVGGSRTIGEHVRSCYAPGGVRAFDVDLMKSGVRTGVRGGGDGGRGSSRRSAKRPPPREAIGTAAVSGSIWAASDYKVAAVKDGVPVFSAEFAWNPKDQADPGYHFTKLNEGITKAAGYLPGVDAIGGSTAGVVVDNQIRVASLFRSGKPVERFGEAKTIFRRFASSNGVCARGSGQRWGCDRAGRGIGAGSQERSRHRHGLEPGGRVS